MEQIIVRRAIEADFGNIHQMLLSLLTYEHDNFDDSLRLDWPNNEAAKEMLIQRIKNDVVFVVYNGDEAIGYLLGKIFEPSPNSARNIKQANIDNIYIEEKYRKYGLGRMLIESFEHVCKADDVKRISVTVLASNKNAVAFYEKMGLLPRSIIYSGII